MPLTLRSSKSAALTWAEMDANLEFLLGTVGSNSTGGWFKFPNGIIMQFLYVDIPQGSTRTITLPITFPNSAFLVLATKGSIITLAGEYSIGAQASAANTVQVSNSGPSTGVLQGIGVVVFGT